MLVWMCHSLLGRREGKETKYCHAICSSGLNYTVRSLLCAVLCVFVICVVCVCVVCLCVQYHSQNPSPNISIATVTSLG